MDIDLLVTGQNDVDYPLFRKFVHKNHKFFNRMLYGMNNGCDQTSEYTKYEHFIKDDLHDKVTFLDIDVMSNGSKDWRNVSVNKMLLHAKSEWILFTEQDFFIDDRFWNDLTSYLKLYDVISYYSRGRIWPAFMLVKKSIVDKTNKNFSVGTYNDLNEFDENAYTNTKHIVYNKFNVHSCDHFGKFTSDLLELTNKFLFLNDLNVNYTHLSGTTHNHYLIRHNKKELIYNINGFLTYFNECLNSQVNIHDLFKKEYQLLLNLMKI
jgi:hypothetical protein